MAGLGNTGTRRRGGFTLVELLVVVAVIGVLIGVLLPALGWAREAGRLTVSMNQMRQITMGGFQFSVERDNKWPMMPAKSSAGNPLALNSWHYGGKTSDKHWLNVGGGINFSLAKDKPVNPYVYPDLTLADGEGEPGETELRQELPVFRCPSDKRSFQRGWGVDRGGEPMASYEDVGTSYHLNVKWWKTPGAQHDATLDRMVWAQQVFPRGGSVGPSRFVWLYDQTMDVASIVGWDIIGEHGELNRAKAAFVDGHVKYLTVTPGALNTSDYSLLLR